MTQLTVPRFVYQTAGEELQMPRLRMGRINSQPQREISEILSREVRAE